MNPTPRVFRPLGGFVVRAAALPFETIVRSPTPAAPGVFAAPLPALLALPHVQEALGLASPELRNAALRPRPSGAGGDKLERALWRYLLRMSARATPFGVFASLSVGSTDGATRLRLAPLPESRRRVQIDVLALQRLVHRLYQLPGVRPSLPHRPVAEWAHLGEQIRAIPLPMDPSEGVNLLEIKAKPLLLRCIELARGNLPLTQLAEALEPHWPRSTPAKRLAYVEKLAQLGFLVPSLLPATTGRPALEQIEQVIARTPALSSEAPLLAQLRSALAQLGQLPPGEGQQLYREVEALLAPSLPERSDPILFHVDLRRPAEALVLGNAVHPELLRVARLFVSLPPYRNARLQRFIERFEARYDGRLVPLLEAVDDDHGVGFSKSTFQEDLPILDGLPSRVSSQKTSLGEIERRLLEKLASCREVPYELELKEGDFPTGKAEPPLTFALQASLSAEDEAQVERGEFQLFQVYLLQPSGTVMLGRFCGLDPAIEELTRRYVEAEEQSSKELLLDRADAPPGRIANVVQRPGLSTYELVVQGRSGAPPERQIDLQDLLVGVEGGRVVLYSKRLQRRLRVRATHAFNAASDVGLPLVHFLSAVEEQHMVGRSAVNWGGVQAPFLPRLRLGKTILAPARWRIEGAELKALTTSEALLALRERRGMPRWVSISEADNVLPIDLEDELGRGLLLQELQGKSEAILEEFLPALLPRPLRGPEGTYVHEMIVPFVADPLPRPEPRTVRLEPAEAPVVPPGREVLYLKFYGAPGELERWFLGGLGPALPPLPWMFVRYEDSGGYHLRLRIFGPSDTLQGLLWPLLQRADEAVRQGLIQKVQLDSYEPETERYGGPAGVRLVEQMFCVDSAACAGLLALGVAPPDRWRLTMLALDAWLEDAGLDLPARHAFCERSANDMAREHGDVTKTLAAIGEEARRQRAAIEETFTGSEPPWSDARGILEQRAEALRPLLTQQRELEARGALTVPATEQLWSLGHMTCNRIFSRSARAQEMVVWGLLERRYRAQIARSRGK
ncbi:MAG: lantibiotic dehydratase [Polyangiaceae bacterium]|nr:lantibiotic dehydratase [Polyangiaceae bacterium]